MSLETPFPILLFSFTVFLVFDFSGAHVNARPVRNLHPHPPAPQAKKFSDTLEVTLNAVKGLFEEVAAKGAAEE